MAERHRKLDVGDVVKVWFHYSRYTRPGEPDYLWQKRPARAVIVDATWDDPEKDEYPAEIRVVVTGAKVPWIENYIQDHDNIYDNGMEEVFREFPSVVMIDVEVPYGANR